MSKKPIVLPSSSTNTEDDTVQVVIPDKRRILSDVKALVDYHDTQIQMAQRETQQAQNQLTLERNRVSELEAENEDMKQKLEKAEESVITMQQEKSEHANQMYSLKSQVQSLQNQLRESQRQTNSLLNITKSHASHVRNFWKNFNETEKDLITLVPGYKSSSFCTSTTAAASFSAEIPTTSSVETSLPAYPVHAPSPPFYTPVSKSTTSSRHKVGQKKVKNKSTEKVSVKKKNPSNSVPKSRKNAKTVTPTSTPAQEIGEETQDVFTPRQLETEIASAFSRGDNQRLLALSIRGLRMNTNNIRCRILKVHALTNLGHIQEAQNESTKILLTENIIDKMDTFALCTMANCCYQADKLDMCLEYYRQVTIKEPGNETANKYLLKIKAISDLREIAKVNGKESVEIYKKCLELIRGLEYLRNRVIESNLLYLCSVNTTDDRVMSMEFVNQAISCYPKFAKAIFQRAKLYVLDKKYDNALADIQEVLKLDPKLPGTQALIDACCRAISPEQQAQVPSMRSPGQDSAQPSSSAVTTTPSLRKSTTSVNEIGEGTAKRPRN